MVSPRRNSDKGLNDYDHRPERGDTTPSDSLSRWIIRLISLAIIAALGLYTNSLINKISSLESSVADLKTNQTLTNYRLDYLQKISEDNRSILEEVRSDLKTVKKRQ